YALSKHFGEQLMDAAVARSDIRCISIRPSWVQYEGNYETNLGPQVRDSSELSANLWSYVDVYDLADAIVLATESDLPGHE
ncbi:NAD(P)-dependent oxidoreductase, partial [Leifsonia sp. SIMBA_070]